MNVKTWCRPSLRSIYLGAALSYMVGLFILSSIPGDESAPPIITAVPPILQDLLHVPAYGLLAVLWVMVFQTRGWALSSSERAGAWIATLYGGVNELQQRFVPGRFMSLEDFLLDLAGIGLAVLALRRVFAPKT